MSNEEDILQRSPDIIIEAMRRVPPADIDYKGRPLAPMDERTLDALLDELTFSQYQQSLQRPNHKHEDKED